MKAVLLWVILAWTSLVHATQAPEALYEKMQSEFPDLKVDMIRAGPMPGLYTVHAGPLIYYISEDGQYVFAGDIFDLGHDKQNITEDARKLARVQAINQFDKDKKAIWYPAKSQKYLLTVFTDIDCGFCRKFHRDIAALNEQGVSVRYLAFPRQGPGSQAFKEAASVWCNNDPVDAMNKAKNGEAVPENVCGNNTIDAQFELGMMAGVNATPALLLPDGTLVFGYMKPNKLLKALEKTG